MQRPRSHRRTKCFLVALTHSVHLPFTLKCSRAGESCFCYWIVSPTHTHTNAHTHSRAHRHTRLNLFSSLLVISDRVTESGRWVGSQSAPAGTWSLAGQGGVVSGVTACVLTAARLPWQRHPDISRVCVRAGGCMLWSWLDVSAYSAHANTSWS